MKSVFKSITIVVCATLFGACDKNPASIAASVSTAPLPGTPTSAELKINNWGPQSSKAGQIPNKQPDGSMGIWISVPSTKNFGEAQVVFGGQPARVTSVQENAINAAVDGNLLKQAGVKEVMVKQISTGKLITVGQFKIE